MSDPRLRRAVRLLQTLVAVGLSIAVFGICVPFTLLALRLLPRLGLASVVYLAIGAIAGLVFGGVLTARTLRVPSLWPRSFVSTVLVLSLVVVAALIAARFDAFLHV